MTQLALWRPETLDPELNHDFDDKQESIDWEDHIGLANIAANKIVMRTPELRPYFDDIVEDLKVKLWQCATGGTYNSSTGRFSTYAMTCMLRCHDDIVWLYLGYKPRRMFDKRPISLSKEISRGSSMESIIAGTKDPEHLRQDDIAMVWDEILELSDESTRKFLENHAKLGETVRETASEMGYDRAWGSERIARIKRVVRKIKKTDPEWYEIMNEAIS